MFISTYFGKTMLEKFCKHYYSPRLQKITWIISYNKEDKLKKKVLPNLYWKIVLKRVACIHLWQSYTFNATCLRKY